MESIWSKQREELFKFLEKQMLWSNKTWTPKGPGKGRYVYLNEGVFCFLAERLLSGHNYDGHTLAKDLACMIVGGMRKLAAAMGWSKRAILMLNEALEHLPAAIQREKRISKPRKNTKPKTYMVTPPPARRKKSRKL